MSSANTAAIPDGKNPVEIIGFGRLDRQRVPGVADKRKEVLVLGVSNFANSLRLPNDELVEALKRSGTPTIHSSDIRKPANAYQNPQAAPSANSAGKEGVAGADYRAAAREANNQAISSAEALHDMGLHNYGIDTSDQLPPNHGDSSFVNTGSLEQPQPVNSRDGHTVETTSFQSLDTQPVAASMLDGSSGGSSTDRIRNPELLPAAQQEVAAAFGDALTISADDASPSTESTFVDLPGYEELK